MTFQTFITQWPTRAAFASDIGITETLAIKWGIRDSIPSGFWLAARRAARKRRFYGDLESFAKWAERKKRKAAQ